MKPERAAVRETKPAPARLTPRLTPRPTVNRTVERPRQEPSQPSHGGGMYAKEPRKNSRRELEIPTFLRRQMD